jgi:hypothetical protein
VAVLAGGALAQEAAKRIGKLVEALAKRRDRKRRKCGRRPRAADAEEANIVGACRADGLLEGSVDVARKSPSLGDTKKRFIGRPKEKRTWPLRPAVNLSGDGPSSAPDIADQEKWCRAQRFFRDARLKPIAKRASRAQPKDGLPQAEHAAGRNGRDTHSATLHVDAVAAAVVDDEQAPVAHLDGSVEAGDVLVDQSKTAVRQPSESDWQDKFEASYWLREQPPYKNRLRRHVAVVMSHVTMQVKRSVGDEPLQWRLGRRHQQCNPRPQAVISSCYGWTSRLAGTRQPGRPPLQAGIMPERSRVTLVWRTLSSSERLLKWTQRSTTSKAGTKFRSAALVAV